MGATLTIDGKTIPFRTGMSVLDAAKKAGIFIPTLCTVEGLPASGSCRLCLVSIKGMNGFQPSCTTPAKNGMVVVADSPELKTLRRNIFELILSEHPYTCLVCDKRLGCADFHSTIRKAGVVTGCQDCPKNGGCELQSLAEYFGLTGVSYPIHYAGRPVEQDDPFFDRDYNLCVLCSRCVRQCQEIRHNGTLGFSYRGTETVVGTPFGLSHLAVQCEFCGACVDVCPTGALFDKESKWEGSPETTRISACPYCSVGCTVQYRNGKNGLVGTMSHGPDPGHGQICVRGRYGIVGLMERAPRLKTPMLREEGSWREAGWDEALNRIASEVRKGSSSAVFVSPQATNEAAYAFQALARRVFRTPHLFTASPWADEEPVEILRNAVLSGIPAFDSIEKASSLIVWGSDLTVSHPIVALLVKRARLAGAPLLVVDPRRTAIARIADLHLQVSPGEDIPLLESWISMLKNEKIDPAVLRRTKIGREDLLNAVKILKGDNPLILAGSGLLLGTGRKNWQVLLDFSKLISADVLPVAGESNLLGALAMGCHPGLPPGFHGRERAADAFPVTGSYGKSLDALRSGAIRFAMMPEEGFGLFGEFEFLVSYAVFLPPWHEKAHALLPVPHLSESNGTLFNAEGRLIPVTAIQSAKEAKPEWWIASQLAARLGGGLDWKNCDSVTREIGARIGLKKKGRERFLCPEVRSAGKVRRKSSEVQMEKTTKTYPYRLMVGESLFHYRGTALTEIPDMAAIHPLTCVEIHPQDASDLKVADGGRLVLTARDGVQIQRIARITDRVLPGTLYAYRQEPVREHNMAVKVEKS